MSKLTEISVFFPAFNEKANLERMVRSLRVVLPQVSRRHEIIIVDDGSKDGTGELADGLAGKFGDVWVVHHPRNLGYGAALRSGIAACRYRYIFFTDGDCQFDVRDIEKLVPYIEDHDIVLGYRARRKDNFLRLVFAWGWNWLIRILLGVKVRDLDCAFKLFRAEILKPLKLLTTGAMINAEILASARRRGFFAHEVPVRHLPRLHGRSTGGNPRVILMAFGELFQFIFRQERFFYAQKGTIYPVDFVHKRSTLGHI
ncbi:MAG: glycosyltransferase family 2 protein [Elusimicrobia bacterium]|nr:glycosyltransferase family 2 protein [Elusimicrobiota bacterium]